MRRSFGPGMGGGGCGGGGGGIIKTVHRAVRTGIGGGASPEPFSYSATRSTTSNCNSQPINTGLFISSKNNNSSPPCSYLNQPVPAAPPPPPNWDNLLTPPATGNEFDWEYVDGCGSDGESVYGVYDDIVYGGVPSEDEVYHAVSSLQEVLEPVSFAQLITNRGTYGSNEDELEKISSPTSFHKSTSKLDWIEPSLQVWNSTSALQVHSCENVYDAFHLLQTEPLVQRMVISLSSDKAVWDAVMNNEVVRELRESVNKDKSISEGSEDSVEDPNPVTKVLGWIFVNTKEKVVEIVDKITKIVNDLFQPVNKGEKPERDVNEDLNSFDKKLKSSFFLSIMILLIVVVSRARKY